MTAPTTFDDIQLARPELAKTYLTMLVGQPGRPLALFARRRVGKTYFLARDLAPAAKEMGMYPVYADLWLNQKDPLAAIVHALEEALDDVAVPSSMAGKTAKTPVKSVGVLGTSVQFGDEPTRRDLPEDLNLRLDALVPRLSKAAGNKPILLMLDEIQTLGEKEDGVAMISALRAVLTKYRAAVHGVFTGSSQDALTSMTVTAGAPMYQFVQLLNFPNLGDDYLELLANHFASVHPGKYLELTAMQKVFAHVGYKPALMKDIVKEMSAEGNPDFEYGLKAFLSDESRSISWATLLQTLDEPSQAALVALTYAFPPTSQDTVDRLNALQVWRTGVTISKLRTALKKLHGSGVLNRIGNNYTVEDALLADYIKNLSEFAPLALPPAMPHKIEAG